MKSGKLIIAVLILSGIGWAAGPAQASVDEAVMAETAEEALRLATDEVLALIKDGQAYAKEDPERFYTEVEALLRPLVDFKRFSRNVMGAHYKRASPEQRERFAESFKWSLVRTYALALTEFHEGKVEVLPGRAASPNKVSVTQEITFEGKTYVVVYNMLRKKTGAWTVQNIIVEGVNIGVNYKTQFASAMKDPAYGRDMDRVIDAWSRTIEGQDEEPAGEAAAQT